ncbi:MAG: cytochrome C oxidase Cbb3 [Deltaproteobacteria bacterium]|nr:cytochrome C oxidase Cbb3 [Deltaproteobacteria bacterium]
MTLRACSRRLVVLTAVVVVAVVFAGACGPVDGRAAGEALFHDPRVSRSPFNSVTCATCHDDGTADPAATLPGASLVDVVFRPSWWGGQAGSLKQAVDACFVHFLREQPLAADDPRGRALYEYLLSISRREATPPAPLTIVENVTTVGAGDPRRGSAIWDRACASCHGAPRTGQGRSDERASIVPAASAGFAAETGFPVELVIVEKVRHGGFFGVGGVMPPFSVEALSDDDLRDLLGFVLAEP